MDFVLMVIWLVLSVLVIICGRLLESKLGDFIVAIGAAMLLLLAAASQA